jgi:hypothetical protein
MRRHQDGRAVEWRPLVEQVRAQMALDPSPTTPAAAQLAGQWYELFRDMVGNDPSTVGRFRTATEVEPVLRLGRAMNDEMVVWLRAAQAAAEKSA